MKIGIVKETKDLEGRVAMTPEGVRELVAHAHQVLIETNAGFGAGFQNHEYTEAGAELVCVDRAWDTDLVVKVKEPTEAEYGFLNQQILFTFLHLAGADPKLTDTLLEKNTTALAYETLEDANGKLVLLAPMSAVAGNMSVSMGSYYLAQHLGGKGIQIGSVLGSRHGKVLIIGDGVVGMHAAQVAYGMGGDVTVFGLGNKLKDHFKKLGKQGIKFKLSKKENIQAELYDADLVIGAVLCKGGKAPYVICKDMIRSMQPGSVMVDVSIDQGGCFETSKPTTHSDPIYSYAGVTHYCVTNMPGAYPRSSTIALAEATLPYILKLADDGLAGFKKETGLLKAINIYNKHITCKAVADALNLPHKFKSQS